MRRVLRLVLPVVVLAALPVATATAQSNVYGLSVSLNGQPGVTGGPQPVGVGVTLSTGEANGDRSAVLSRIVLSLAGIQLGGIAVPGCDAARLNDPYRPGPAACPAGSAVGTGALIADIGPPSDQRSKDLYCYLSVTLYNGAGPGQLLIWLQGSPKASNIDPRLNCVQDTREALVAQLATTPSGSEIAIDLPENLAHPAGGALDSAFTTVRLDFTKPATATGYTSATACPSATAVVTAEGAPPQPVTAPPATCGPPISACPTGQVGQPPNCFVPPPPQEKLPVKITVPKACVRGALTAKLSSTVAQPLVGNLVLRLDRRRVKAIAHFPGRVTVPARLLKRPGRHVLTVTGASGQDAHATPATKTFRVCAAKKKP